MPPASRDNAAAELPLSVLMAISGSASRTAQCLREQGRDLGWGLLQLYL